MSMKDCAENTWRKKSADAKPRNISIISSPVIEEGIPERHVKKNEKIL